MATRDPVFKRHVFTFNKKDNGGEALSLSTDVILNGDPDGVYLNQRLTLQSYCNSASFELIGASLTPDSLRQLANELEVLMAEARASSRLEAAAKA